MFDDTPSHFDKIHGQRERERDRSAIALQCKNYDDQDLRHSSNKRLDQMSLSNPVW